MSLDQWKEAVRAKRGFAFLRFLTQLRVEYMLIGGAAMAFHGLRDAPDDFADLDILINPTRSNAARFAEAMNLAASAAGKMVAHKFDPNLMGKQFANFVPDKSQFDCEFVALLRPSDFTAAMGRTVNASFAMMRVPVMALQDLRARKNQAIGHVTQRLRDVEESTSAVHALEARGGSLDFSPINETMFGPVATRLFGLLLESGIDCVFYGNSMRVGNDLARLKLLFPLEVYLPCDEKSLAIISTLVQRATGLGAAASGILVPGVQFQPSENEHNFSCRIAGRPEEFMVARQRAMPGLILGKNVHVADSTFLQGIFDLLGQVAQKTMAKQENELARITAKMA